MTQLLEEEKQIRKSFDDRSVIQKYLVYKDAILYYQANLQPKLKF